MSNEKVHSNQYVVGLKETLKALKDHQAASLVIAKDVQIHLLTDVLLLAQEQHVPIAFSESRLELGNQFGIQVKAMIAAYLKDGL
ncbi:ribosomal L7Ae/L30e/S12e/Gadd45 family protein [Macrococcus lamae]|uniref:50S ribosomal protein L7ae-like protein n=1 Tax=Macrococcus lamae TaxID=198484 RepID=A0A4R6BUN6_9STAP|nr:ribosomal L7Ae/L30e/S12e/Gadd45 family protein [Macrococcus lamae]TDM12013.1 50S ribosomal protein L7ae-like protein [Macrococcus lamae]